MTRDRERMPGVKVDPDQTDDWTADAPKLGTWDVYVPGPGGKLKLVSTLEELSAVMGLEDLPPAARRRQLAHLRDLPVWRSMPDPLKGEIAVFLARTRPTA